MSELYLLNDDDNTFHYVYATLMKELNFMPIQAEQCCLIAHHKGKVHIKSGDIIELLETQTALELKKIKTELVNP